MEKDALKPIIVWLGHGRLNRDALKNLQYWLSQNNSGKKSKLLDGKGICLSFDSNQERIEGPYKSLLHEWRTYPLAVFTIISWETVKIGLGKPLKSDCWMI